MNDVGNAIGSVRGIKWTGLVSRCDWMWLVGGDKTISKTSEIGSRVNPHKLVSEDRE